MKKYLLNEIEKNIKAMQENLQNASIEERTKIINNEYFLGKNAAFLEILEKVSFSDFAKTHERQREIITKALQFTSKIYSL